MSFEIRKIVSYVEETFIEGGKAGEAGAAFSALLIQAGVIGQITNFQLSRRNRRQRRRG